MFVCSTCTVRTIAGPSSLLRPLGFRSAARFSSFLPISSQPSCALLPHRSVLQITGPDAQKFLKGLTSRDVDSIGGGYSGFMNASGRLLHAVMIVPTKGGYYIIHETSSDHPEPLLTFLPPFKLRSKVKFRDVAKEWDVWSVWGGDAGINQAGPARSFKFGSGGSAEATWTWPDGPAPVENGCWDLRAGWGGAGMGRQILVPKGDQPTYASDHDVKSPEDYHLRRMLLGVPEGSEEIVPGSALPLESCMDVHGGVDFRKGCYLGQELTVRTYHTGATRKRILPIKLDSNPSSVARGEIMYHPPSTSASKKSKSAGKILSLHPTASNIGLGLVRLEMAERACWTDASEKGRLTVDLNGKEYQVETSKGEALSAAVEAGCIL